MNIRDLRKQLGDTQSGFAKRYNIPFRTIQNWESGVRKPPEYIRSLLEERVKADLINRRTAVLPEYDHHKKDLPKRKDYLGAVSWLQAVRKVLGEDIVFALDEALMCHGLFGGRNDESIVWIYGGHHLSGYNGIVILGEHIDPLDIQETDGLKYTSFNRTLFDSFSNESLLDMQGITEALGNYYYRNGEEFAGLTIAPEYHARFKELAEDAISYYDS